MTTEALTKTSQYVSNCLQLAILLEVSAYPKPGNVHRTADFQGTKYEHFLSSAVAVAPHFKNAAERGVMISSRTLRPEEAEVGRIIKEAVMDMDAWQHGGNTLLGSIILLTPMAAAAGITLTKGEFSITKLRKNLKRLVESTTPEDAVNVYEAIETAKPGGLGKAPKLDATDAASKKKIMEEKVSLYEVFKISAPWDSICSEWVNNYHITFDIGYPFLTQQLEETNGINTATVHTFLKILSEVPDTLIARKTRMSKAEEVSTQARRVLEAGGLKTQKGRNILKELDRRLRDPRHQLNPGTTADLTASALALATLNGYRP